MAKSKKKKDKTRLGFSKVEVLGHHFDIIETDRDDVLLDGGRNVALGFVKYFEGIIVIDSRQSTESMQQTFYHELLHAIDFILHNEQVTYDEETVNVLARGLNTVRLT